MPHRRGPPDQATATDPADKLATTLHHRLAEQVASMREGQDWQQWLAVAARFHTYSFSNTMLILAQRPDATAVAGYQAWKTLGRQVNKGEKGIQILAPLVRRTAPANHAPDDGDTEPTEHDPQRGAVPSRHAVTGFRVTHVWDVTQTSGAPLPAPPRPRLLAGQAPDGLWDALTAAAADSGFVVERGPCGTANGLTDPAARTVRIRPDVDDAQAVKTLAHELAHVRLHTSVGGTASHPAPGTPTAAVVTTHRPGSITEVEAESVAYLIAAAHGLDTTGYTFPYVWTWAAASHHAHPEDVVRATGQRVLTAARWILERTQPTADTTKAQVPQQLADRVAVSTLAADGVRVRSATQRAGAAAPRDLRLASSSTRTTTTAADASRSVDRDELLALQAAALTFYLEHREGSWVPAYLQRRGLDAALDAPWNAGHAPRGWTCLVDHLRHLTGTDDAALLASGLAVRARTGNLIDRFRDRLVLPLNDADGVVIAFVARSHPDADPERVPKYLNSPTTALYSKSDYLYGLGTARPELARGARPVLVEGPLDAIAVTSGTAGRCAGLASCGTAVTAAQVRLLARTVDLHRSGVTVAFDPDTAGDTARRSALQLLAVHGADPSATTLPVGVDPAGLLERHGSGALTAALTDATTPLADVVIDRALNRWVKQLDSPVARVNAVQTAAPLIASLTPAAALRQADRVATLTDMPLHVVHGEVTKAITAEPLSPRGVMPSPGRGTGSSVRHHDLQRFIPAGVTPAPESVRGRTASP